MYKIYKSNLCNISESKFKDRPIIMYNLNKDWYTELPTNQVDLSKLLLILNVYFFQ